MQSVDYLEITCWDTVTGQPCNNATVSVAPALGIELTFDQCQHMLVSGVHFDGLGVKHTATTRDATCDNTTYTGCTFSRAPGTSLNFYFWQSSSFKKAFSGISIRGCTFREFNGPGVTIISWPTDGDLDANRDSFWYTTDVEFLDNHFADAWTNETDALGTTPSSAPGIILNRVRNAIAEENTFIRMAGSGLWSTQTYNLTFSRNLVAHSRRVTDACANHVDIQNDDSVFEHNIGFKNEVRAHVRQEER